MKPYFETDAPEDKEFYYKLTVPNPNGVLPVKLTVTVRIDYQGAWMVAGIESEDQSYMPSFDDLPEQYQDEVTDWAELTSEEYVSNMNSTYEKRVDSAYESWVDSQSENQE